MKPFNEFKFAPIQFHSTKTGEIFNIGVIMTDENGETAKIKTINSFNDVAKCLKIKNPDGHDFVLEMLHKNFNDKKVQFGKEYSNAIKVETLDWYNTSNSLDEEIEIAFNEFVTLTHAHDARRISEYSSQSIVTSLKKLADTRNMKNINFRKSTNIAHKRIDVITFQKDELLVAGEVCSPHVEGFMQHWASSMMALNQLQEKKKIKLCMMYLPIMKLITGQLRQNYGYAKDYSTRNNIKVIDSEHPQSFLYEIEKETRQLDYSLF